MKIAVKSTHAVLRTAPYKVDAAREALQSIRPDVRIMGAGEAGSGTLEAAPHGGGFRVTGTFPLPASGARLGTRDDQAAAEVPR